MSEEVYQAIPHRPPFLFIDSISDINERGIRATRTVREDEPHFAGHYPGNPIMPGVLLCETVFQAAAIYLSRIHGENAISGGGTEKVPVLARIQDAKFKLMVKPGDKLEVEAEHTEKLGGFHFLSGRIRRDGKNVLTVKFSLALVEQQPQPE
jgi:3-hydroxyacyl-[acyl-carrier-protein] dehydratase